MFLPFLIQDYLLLPTIFSIYKDRKTTLKQSFQLLETCSSGCFGHWMTMNDIFTSPQISQPAPRERCSWTGASPRSSWASSPSAVWRWRPASLGPQKAQHLTECHWAHPLYPGVSWTQENQDTEIKSEVGAFHSKQLLLSASPACRCKETKLNWLQKIQCLFGKAYVSSPYVF